MINNKHIFDNKTNLNYNDISIVPRIESTIDHRSKCNPSIQLFGNEYKLPLISSPMPDVTNGRMAWILAYYGCMGIIHRFQSIDEQVYEYSNGYKNIFNDISSEWELFLHEIDLYKNLIGCAIGAVGDYQERFEKLYDSGCRIFCIDTANGYNSTVKNCINWIRTHYQNDVYLIAGNVATKEGYLYLDDLGVNAVRVGIAGGSACITRTETSIYMPMISSVHECVTAKEKENRRSIIIADGGVKLPSDACKLLGIGADMIMCGSVFAGTKQSPGNTIKIKDEIYKIYRGAASFSVQIENDPNKEVQYNEGNEMIVPYKGDVVKTINRFSAGIKSSMSYVNAFTLEQYRNNVSFILI